MSTITYSPVFTAPGRNSAVRPTAVRTTAVRTTAVRPAAVRPAAVRAAKPVGRPVRLTTRGRVVLTMLFLGLLLAAFTGYGARSAASGTPGAPVPTRTVVVSEGDTLWEIAGAAAAPGHVREMVDRIEELNALESSMVFEGQELAVPLR